MSSDTPWSSLQTFDLFNFFAGETTALGIFQDRKGEVKRRFVVSIVGTVEGNELVLDERFDYEDGAQEQRRWCIRRLSSGQYAGNADDIPGSAKGEIRGDTLHWCYQMLLPYKNGKVKVDFIDRMVMMPGNLMINRADVKKYGFLLGSVTISFVKN